MKKYMFLLFVISVDVDSMAIPVVPDFASGLAVAVGQMTSALKLPTGWVASPSLRWTPSGATLLVRWGPVSGRAPGGEEAKKRKRSAAQQQRSALRAAEHKQHKAKQQHQQRIAAGLRPEAPVFAPSNSDSPQRRPSSQRGTSGSMEVDEGRVSERRELLDQTAATPAQTREGWSQAPPTASSPTTTKKPTAARISEDRGGQLQAREGRAGAQQLPRRSMHAPLQSHPPGVHHPENDTEAQRKMREDWTAIMAALAPGVVSRGGGEQELKEATLLEFKRRYSLM